MVLALMSKKLLHLSFPKHSGSCDLDKNSLPNLRRSANPCHSLVVLYEPKGAVLLFYEENRGGHWKFRWLDTAHLEVFSEEAVQLGLFSD